MGAEERAAFLIGILTGWTAAIGVIALIGGSLVGAVLIAAVVVGSLVIWREHGRAYPSTSAQEERTPLTVRECPGCGAKELESGAREPCRCRYSGGRVGVQYVPREQLIEAEARAQTAEAELEEARWELHTVREGAKGWKRHLEERAEQAETALRRAVGALEEIARATQRADALTANWMVDVAADTLASPPDPKSDE